MASSCSFFFVPFRATKKGGYPQRRLPAPILDPLLIMGVSRCLKVSRGDPCFLSKGIKQYRRKTGTQKGKHTTQNIDQQTTKNTLRHVLSDWLPIVCSREFPMPCPSNDCPPPQPRRYEARDTKKQSFLRLCPYVRAFAFVSFCLGMGQKLNTRNWTAGLSPCFHVPGNAFGGYPIFDQPSLSQHVESKDFGRIP